MIQILGSTCVVLLLMVVGWRLPSTGGRQLLFLAASYLFYANWGMGFLSILIISSLMNYTCGCALRRKVTAPRLWIGIALNLLPLAFFKYLPEFLELGPAGSWQYDLGRQIIMPLGLSFWTFLGLSYLFDIYFEEELDPSLLEFCLYMAFWPTVASGPICRLPSMLPQFRQLSPFSWDDLSAGSLRVIQGVMMKFVLAQILGSGWLPGEGIAAGFDQMKGGWGGVDVWLLGMGFGFLLFLTSRATHIWSLESPVFSAYVCRKTLIAPFSRQPLPFSGRAGICHFHSGFATMYSIRLPPPGGATVGGHM